MKSIESITVTNLNDFFYQKLSKKNKQVQCPLPEEFIFYSSLVLEKYSNSEIFFTSSQGKMIEKFLGIKLLESQNMSKDQKVTEIKDVGDTILVQLGLFSDSIKNKLTSRTYYLALAQNAYAQLNNLDSQFYDIPNFYKLFASSLDKTILLLENVSNELHSHKDKNYLFELSNINKKAV